MQDELIKTTRFLIDELDGPFEESDDRSIVMLGLSKDLALATGVVDRIQRLEDVRRSAKRFKWRAEQEGESKLAIGWAALDQLARFAIEAVRLVKQPAQSEDET